jgi:hypothetical protein
MRLGSILCIPGAAIVAARAVHGAEALELRPVRVPLIEQMPALPDPYAMRDWQEVTRDYLEFILDFDKRGQHLPLVRWQDARHTMIWMPAYVGNRDGPESINYLAAVVSGSLVGLDMRTNRGHDWVAMATNFFSPADGIFLDWPKGHSGGSFWYDVLPNVLFFELDDLYSGDPERERLVQSVAERWYLASVALGGGTNSPVPPNFDHTGFDLRKMQPFDNGERIEPEGAAGIAWLEYMAWQKSKDPRFLAAADWALRALQQKPLEANPLYEVLLPYAAFTAARMNAELGRNYDVSRLVNWCFEARPKPQARPNWGVITGSWNGLEVNGLLGSVTDGGGYAFAMNTFQYAGTLAPLARYDARYARALGKWILNLANAARLFYPNAHDAEHQSSYAWARKYDPKSVIAYEGLRKWQRSASSVARADYRTSAGRVVQGNYKSTRYYREEPPDLEVLEESASSAGAHLDHTWSFELPDAPERFLVVAAERVDRGHQGNAFAFSYATNPAGPFTAAFRVSGSNSAQVTELPAGLSGKLFVRAESSDCAPGHIAQDQLRVDAMAISYRSAISPYAQGDLIVSFIDLVKDYTVPIVLYRPAAVVTDLGLYGSSHVGNLGGLIKPTNVEKILRLDLLKTDYFHGPAYPTFLYYNPYGTPKVVEADLGQEPKDVYDAVSKTFLLRSVRGKTPITLEPDSARVLVLTPAGGQPSREGPQTLINGVVVDYGN